MTRLDPDLIFYLFLTKFDQIFEPNDLLLSASPAGTLDSGHGSEQTLEYRDGSPSTRSPSNHSSPRHSPRRTVGSLPEEIDGARESNGARESIDENPWLNELGMIVKFLQKFLRFYKITILFYNSLKRKF